VKIEKPIVSLSVWSAIFAVTFAVIMLKFLAISIKSDKTGVSLCIIALFFAGWIISFFHAKSINKDWNEIHDINRKGKSININSDNRLIGLIQKVKCKSDEGVLISFENIVNSYKMKMDAPRRIVVALSSILITIGLIGTILGLINSMAGINDIVMSVNASRDGLISGMQNTLYGMGTAFYSTLYGAIFGGVMLRLLSNNALSSESLVCGEVLEYLELNIGISNNIKNNSSKDTSIFDVEYNNILKSFKDTQDDIIKCGSFLQENVASLCDSLAKTNQEVKNFSVSFLDSRIMQTADHVEDIAASLRNISNKRK